MTRVLTIWDDRYCVEAASTNSTLKQREVMRLAHGQGLIRIYDDPKKDCPLEKVWAHIATVHDPDFVKAVRTGKPRTLAQSQGFKWSPEFADALVRIWRGHIIAAYQATHGKGGLVLHPVSGAHHADYFSGGGFCTFNYLAGAGQAGLQLGWVSRVGVIDLDAHHGDGTYRLVGADPRFATFDIAGSMWTAVADHKRSVMVVAHDVADYRKGLQGLPKWLDREFPEVNGKRPYLMQYQAGMDCFKSDYVGGIDGVTKRFLSARDAFVIKNVRERGIPLVVNLAGGYLTGVSEYLHLETVRRMAEWQNTGGGRDKN